MGKLKSWRSSVEFGSGEEDDSAKAPTPTTGSESWGTAARSTEVQITKEGAQNSQFLQWHR